MGPPSRQVRATPVRLVKEGWLPQGVAIPSASVSDPRSARSQRQRVVRALSCSLQLMFLERDPELGSLAVANRFEAYHQELTAHFSESQIVEIVGIVVNMNVWTRLKLAQGATPTMSST